MFIEINIAFESYIDTKLHFDKKVGQLIWRAKYKPWLRRLNYYFNQFCGISLKKTEACDQGLIYPRAKKKKKKKKKRENLFLLN